MTTINAKPKNRKMANKGMELEKEVIASNANYKAKKKALVQKISTPWKVIRAGKRIVSAFPESKSTLDFRGTIKGGISISFDCKESEDERGLPLKYIEDHQIEYMKNALEMNEVTFILCSLKVLNKKYIIPGDKVITYWDRWQQNKGRKGFNYIPVEQMTEIKYNEFVLDYLERLEELIYGKKA